MDAAEGALRRAEPCRFATLVRRAPRLRRPETGQSRGPMQIRRAGGTYTGVQALRFVAALLVVMTHATLYTSERLDDSLPVWHFGEVGVDIFFVISGFVMMVSTQRLVGRRDGWKYFWMRRTIRIVPLYWIATTIKLLALVVAPAAILHATLDPRDVVLSYLFLPSYNVDGLVQPLLGVGWTL